MTHWGAFLLASLVLAVTPGPGVLYVVTRTLAQGRVAGLASVLGVALGNLGNALAAALGLAALFAVSALAFEVLKYAGAAYLCWLAWRSLRASPAGSPAASTGVGGTPVAPRRLLRDGLLVALLNPKTTLFFAAFLPQFIAPGASPVTQGILLGAAFVVVAACTDAVYVLAASRAGPWLARRAQTGAWAAAGRWLTAGIYVGLGVYTAVSGSRPRA